MNVFFKPNDYQFYLDLLKEWSNQAQLDIWAYCLMNNHIHIIAVPHNIDSLRLALSQTHRRYASMLNKRENTTGHLWEGRFKSYPIDNDAYLLSAVRYIERNPLTAGIVKNPKEYLWSSAAPHINKAKHALLNDAPLRAMISNWEYFLAEQEHPHILKELESH